VYVLDQALVDSHLVAVPGLGTLTTRGLAGGDLQDLGGEADGSLDAEVLGLGALDEVGGDYRATSASSSFSCFSSLIERTLLESLDLAGSQGDTDAVDLGALPELALLRFVVRHFWLRDEKISEKSRLLRLRACKKLVVG
jgi:hypothetical protein